MRARKSTVDDTKRGRELSLMFARELWPLRVTPPHHHLLPNLSTTTERQQSRHSLPASSPHGASLHGRATSSGVRSEEHTSELQSPCNLVCRLLLEKKNRQSAR